MRAGLNRILSFVSGLGLRAQLLLFALACLLPAAALIGIGAFESARDMRDAAQDQTRVLADQVDQALASKITELERVLAQLSRRTPIRRFDFDECAVAFRDIALSFPSATQLTLSSATGLQVCSHASNPAVRTPPTKADWFQRALAAPGLMLSEPLLEPATQRWVIMPSYPVRDEQGRPIGLLTVQMDLLTLQAQVLPSTLDRKLTIAVLSSQAAFLLRYPDPALWHGKTSINVARTIARIRGNASGFELGVGRDGVSRLYSYRKFSQANWLIIAALPEQVVLAPYYSRLRWSAASGIVTLLLCGLLAQSFSRALTRPARRLAETAQAVADGDAQARAPELGPQELRAVSRQFNLMLDQLQTHVTAIRLSEMQRAGIINTAMDAIVTIDADLNIILFNPAAEQAFGYRAEQVLGRQIDMLVPEALRPGHAQLIHGFGQNGPVSRSLAPAGGVRGLRADGSEFYAEASVSQLEVEGQKYYTAIMRDITLRLKTEQELKRHSQQLESLRDMGLTLLSAASPQQTAQEALRMLAQLVPFWGASATVFDWRHEETIFLALECDAKDEIPIDSRFPFSSYGLSDLEQLKRGQPSFMHDITTLAQPPALVKWLRSHGVRAYLRLPLMAEGQLLGSLNLAFQEVAQHGFEHLEIARAFAQQLAITLQHSMLRLRIERLNRVYAILSGINMLIVRCHDRQELFREACRIATQSGAFKLVWISMLDRSDGEHRIAALQGQTEPPPNADALLQLSAAAIASGGNIVCNQLGSPLPYAAREQLLAQGIRSLACLPLPLPGQRAASLTLCSNEANAFDHEEMQLLAELAGDIAFALDHIEKEERLHFLSYYDELTGLANRSLFHERLAQQISSSHHEQRRLAVIFLDIEHFKSINDVYGRWAGDQVLRLLAARLESFTEEARLLACVKIDRFALIIPEVKSEEDIARQVMQLQEHCVAQPIAILDKQLRVSAKFGIAIFPEDGADAESLLENAEAALKLAQSTNERYLFYRQEMSERAAVTLELENRLRLALERQEFVLHYQPKVDAVSRQIVGVEALLRWQSPERGLVSPAQFIPLLEETGLILEVGVWALRQAARDHLRWLEAGYPAPRIAVNVSPLQLRQADFSEQLQQALSEGAAVPGIDIEITETVVLDNLNTCGETLRRIRDMQVGISIDDFGTGYSSLSYLAKLPTQELKIDQSFVRAMLNDQDAMTLTGAIIALAHSLQLRVVAEGVETDEQATALTYMFCDTLQGYLFSKPLPAAELERRFWRERPDPCAPLLNTVQPPATAPAG
ncbi:MULTISPECIES: EAL domain-containing protein [Chromobacterium]|uniref:EAL domain-containing protein n=1 Tax=Chromobacterium TaxID=535 RepID=UPI001D068756|nr:MULTISPECIES: EAL domain-containing protein [Chromobacterium]UJB31387.1 EAL domain-containing protein [Chromobacterium sp. Beijing]